MEGVNLDLPQNTSAWCVAAGQLVCPGNWVLAALRGSILLVQPVTLPLETGSSIEQIGMLINSKRCVRFVFPMERFGWVVWFFFVMQSYSFVFVWV